MECDAIISRIVLHSRIQKNIMRGLDLALHSAIYLLIQLVMHCSFYLTFI